MKTRTFLLSAFLVVVYLLCWAPYNIVAILKIERSDESPMNWIYYIHHLIGVNSALNPLIYGMPWRQRFSIKGRRLSRIPKGSSQQQVKNDLINDQPLVSQTKSFGYLTINGISAEPRSRSSTMGTIYDRTSIIEESSLLEKSPKQSPKQSEQNLTAVTIIVIAENTQSTKDCEI